MEFLQGIISIFKADRYIKGFRKITIRTKGIIKGFRNGSAFYCLKEQFHLSQGRAGVIAVLYVQIATVGGALLGGSLADWWTRRTPRGRIYVSAIGMTLFLPALYGLGNPGSVALAIMFLVLFGVGWGFFDCNNMPILCQVARSDLRATGYGFMNFVSISCGGFGDWGFGVLKSQGVALPLIFGCFAAVALLSLVVVLLIRPRASNGSP